MKNARVPAVISSRDLGVFAVNAAGPGLRRGHVIYSGVLAVAAVAAVVVSWRWPSFGLLDGFGRERLEFADQLAEAPGVVEQGAVSLELGGAKGAGDGLGSDLADPRWVGAVQVAGVGVAPAPGRTAAGSALDQAAGQAQAEPGDLVGDLALAEFGAGWRGGHALLLSHFCWRIGEAPPPAALKALPSRQPDPARLAGWEEGACWFSGC